VINTMWYVSNIQRIEKLLENYIHNTRPR